jgi:hypothetical protein
VTAATRSLLLTGALWLVLAGDAFAGTVTAESSCGEGSKDPRPFCTVHIDFAAAAGEANVVSVAAAGPAAVVVEDAGAPLTAGPGCVQDGASRARCEAVAEREPDMLRMDGALAAGDGDDVLRVPADGSWFELDGGAGSDRMRGGIVTYADRTRPVRGT